jgi:hypothetical protein
MTHSIRRAAAPIVVAAVLGSLGACEPAAQAVDGSATPPPLPVVMPAGATLGPGHDVDCDRLLATDEVAAVTGGPVRSAGFSVNSCFWLTPLGQLQFVLQTGPNARDWFVELQRPVKGANLKPIGGFDFEAIRDEVHFGGYAPGRAVLMNSVRTIPGADRLVRLVLGRL